ncbi:hypothetical protein JXC34_06705, partial [Candidatus Woesearchaeota archaeon]|nr:hypothetical protein [Candidatus Woesearchaeota archaeon]
MNELLDGEIYRISLGFEGKNLSNYRIVPLHLYDFLFSYDFSENLGNISFRASRDMFLDYMDIEVPTIYDNETVRFFLVRNNTQRELNGSLWKLSSYNSISRDLTRIYLEKRLELADNDIIIVLFKCNIKPKARFNFVIDEGVTLHRKSQIGNIVFKLGDKYQCNSPCIYGTQ